MHNMYNVSNVHKINFFFLRYQPPKHNHIRFHIFFAMIEPSIPIPGCMSVIFLLIWLSQWYLSILVMLTNQSSCISVHWQSIVVIPDLISPATHLFVSYDMGYTVHMHLKICPFKYSQPISVTDIATRTLIVQMLHYVEIQRLSIVRSRPPIVVLILCNSFYAFANSTTLPRVVI